MARTTAELVAELQEKEQSADAAVLVVGFEDYTECVWSDQPEPLKKLNGFLRSGGAPIGIIVRNAREITATPLAEYVGDEDIEKYLITLMSGIGREMRAHGVEQPPALIEKKGG